MIDPRKLRPGELCRLLNSTPLGEVINERQLKRQRVRAGLRIGDARHVDLVRYVAWLLHVRHTPKPQSEPVAPPTAPWRRRLRGPPHWEPDGKPGGRPWAKTHQQTRIRDCRPVDRTDPRGCRGQSRRGTNDVVPLDAPARLPRCLSPCPPRSGGIRHRPHPGRLGQAVETLLAVARDGRRDSDRVRAAIALLDYALRGFSDADALHGEPPSVATAPMDTGDVVQLLSARLRQLDAAELPTGEKARLTASLADALLRALGVDLLDKRLETLQAVLLGRKEKGR